MEYAEVKVPIRDCGTAASFSRATQAPTLWYLRGVPVVLAILSYLILSYLNRKVGMRCGRVRCIHEVRKKGAFSRGMSRPWGPLKDARRPRTRFRRHLAPEAGLVTLRVHGDPPKCRFFLSSALRIR